MTSIVQTLAKQRLITQRNNLMYEALQNSAMQRKMLDNPMFMGNLELANAMETNLAMQNIDNSVQLAAVGAELAALDNIKLDYMA